MFCPPPVLVEIFLHSLAAVNEQIRWFLFGLVPSQVDSLLWPWRKTEVSFFYWALWSFPPGLLSPKEPKSLGKWTSMLAGSGTSHNASSFFCCRGLPAPCVALWDRSQKSHVGSFVLNDPYLIHKKWWYILWELWKFKQSQGSVLLTLITKSTGITSSGSLKDHQRPGLRN